MRVAVVVVATGACGGRATYTVEEDAPSSASGSDGDGGAAADVRPSRLCSNVSTEDGTLHTGYQDEDFGGFAVGAVLPAVGGGPCGSYYVRSGATGESQQVDVQLLSGGKVVSTTTFYWGENITSFSSGHPFEFPGYLTVRVAAKQGGRSLYGIEKSFFDGKHRVVLQP